MKRIFKHVSTARNIHIFFYELAIYGRGIKIEKGILDDVLEDLMVIAKLADRAGDNVSTVQRTEAKESDYCYIDALHGR